MAFTPVYDAEEVQKLFLRWLDGSLDSIHSGGLPIVGVKDCDRRAWGLRAERLAERFSSCEIQKLIQTLMNKPDPYPQYVLMLYSVWGRGIPVSEIAGAMDLPDDTHAQSMLVNAIDTFVSELLTSQSQDH